MSHLIEVEKSLETRQSEMRKAVSVSLAKAVPIKDDSGYATGELIALTYKNESSRNVRAFEGYVEYFDVLGNDLGKSSLQVLRQLKPEESGELAEKHFELRLIMLRDKQSGDLRVTVTWNPEKIVFEDGTVMDTSAH